MKIDPFQIHKLKQILIAAVSTAIVYVAIAVFVHRQIHQKPPAPSTPTLNEAKNE